MNADPNGWTILTMLEWGTQYFEKKRVPSPRLSIEWLLAEVLNLKRLDLYLNYNRPLGSEIRSRLRPLVKRRANHEPLQYITGYSDFLTTRFIVTPDVLIPRMETEQLTETVLDNHPKDENFSVLDIGTGSGCIAISLKKERPNWEIHALDISQKALQVAARNAEQQHTDIHFFQMDIKQDLLNSFAAASFDLVISNPPYVLPTEKNSLEKQVKNFEPSKALFCSDIKAEYKNIIDNAGYLLKKSGRLYLEINARYSTTILSLFDDSKWTATLLNDYDEKPRFIVANHRK